MNVLIFCAVLSLSSSLAFKVSFHTVDLIKFKYDWHPSVVCNRYEFLYHKGDSFTMYLQLANNSSKAVAVVKNELGDTYLTQAFWPEGKPLRFHQKFDKVTIDVELSVNNKCVRERIVEGSQVSTGTNITDFLKHSNICLKKNECLVLVDPTRGCEEQKLTPLPCEHGRHVGTTTSPAPEAPEVAPKVAPKMAPKVAPEVAPEGGQLSKTRNKTKNNPETSRAKHDSKEGAENTYFIIMIVTSIISAVALILLVVVATRHCCWINNPPGIPLISPTNPNPFYENVLFRKECREQIEELEQREYDVVASENVYVEINNRSSTK